MARKSAVSAHVLQRGHDGHHRADKGGKSKVRGKGKGGKLQKLEALLGQRAARLLGGSGDWGDAAALTGLVRSKGQLKLAAAERKCAEEVLPVFLLR
jgi:hypothetical protein